MRLTAPPGTRDLAAGVLGRVAPAELETLDLLGDAYLQDPERILRTRDRDESLGFGLGESQALLTGAVCFVASAVLSQLISRATDSVASQAIPFARRILRRKPPMDASTGPAAVPTERVPLQPAQVEQARETAYACGLKAGLDESMARSVADAVADILGPPAQP